MTRHDPLRDAIDYVLIFAMLLAMALAASCSLPPLAPKPPCPLIGGLIVVDSTVTPVRTDTVMAMYAPSMFCVLPPSARRKS